MVPSRKIALAELTQLTRKGNDGSLEHSGA